MLLLWGDLFLSETDYYRFRPLFPPPQKGYLVCWIFSFSTGHFLVRECGFASICSMVSLILNYFKHVLSKEVTKLPDRSLFRQYHNSSTTSATTDVHMYCGLPVDFSSFNLPRNGDFAQVSVLSPAEISVISPVFFICQSPQSGTGN